MTKIAFFLPSLNIGGIERVFICYANNLVHRGYNIDFVICKKEGLLLNEIDDTVNIICLNSAKLRTSFKKLRNYIKQNEPDFIISGGDYPNIILIISSLFLKTKSQIIISQHNYYNIEVQKLGLWARATKYWMRMLYPLSDKIIAISDGIYSFLLNDIHVPQNKLFKIYNPIDKENIIQKSNEICQFELPDNFIVFIGRISPVKNISLLINSFDKLNIHNTYLVIVGDGAELRQIKDMVQNLRNKKQIIFVGSVSNPLPILSKSKLLVLSSFSEAFPTILLESMCLNIPIVSTPTKGANEILANVKGTFISKSFTDTNEFSHLIQEALTTPKEDLNKNVDKYSINYIIDELEKNILLKSNR